MNTSAPTSASASVPVPPCRVGVLGDRDQVVVQPGRSGCTIPSTSTASTSPGSSDCQQPDDRRAGRADPADHDPAVGELLADHPQRVAQRAEHDDGGAVLVVVEHRDVEQLAQPRLDLEAARRGDVLQVDPAVGRGEDLDRPDDLLGVLGVQADRPRVDAGEPLEQRRLALHHRHRGRRAEVAQPEHGGAVGDDGDGVALDRQPPGVRRVGRDRLADPGDAGGVGAGEVVAGAQADLRVDLELAAEVQQERPVGDLADARPRPAPRAPSVISSTCSSLRALQLMSTTSVAVCASTTSNAVTTPPTCPTATVRSPAALAEAGTSTRAVMAYPGPGTGTARDPTAGRGPRPACPVRPLRGLCRGPCRVCDPRAHAAARRWSSMTVRAAAPGARGSGDGGSAASRPGPDPQRGPRRALRDRGRRRWSRRCSRTPARSPGPAPSPTAPRSATTIPAAVRQQRSVALAVAPLAARRHQDQPDRHPRLRRLRRRAARRAARRRRRAVRRPGRARAARARSTRRRVAQWEECAAVGMPRAVVVARCDHPRADVEATIAACQDAFGSRRRAALPADPRPDGRR